MLFQPAVTLIILSPRVWEGWSKAAGNNLYQEHLWLNNGDGGGGEIYKYILLLMTPTPIPPGFWWETENHPLNR